MDNNKQMIFSVPPWTGWQKAGWFLVGMLSGVPGILIASLANVNHPGRSTATKMAVLGLVADIVIWLLLLVVLSLFAVNLSSSFLS